MFPKKLETITTNLTLVELRAVAEAIEDQKVEWTESSIYASYSVAHFVWEGAQYKLEENYELVDCVMKVGALPSRLTPEQEKILDLLRDG